MFQNRVDPVFTAWEDLAPLSPRLYDGVYAVLQQTNNQKFLRHK